MAGKAVRRSRPAGAPAAAPGRPPRRYAPPVLLAAALLAAAANLGAAAEGPTGFPGRWLAAAFGLGRWWPVPALAAGAWLFRRKTPLSAGLFLKAAGWALFFFSALALADRLPLCAAPAAGSALCASGSGGGRFGAFLALGAFRIGFWAWLLLPLAALSGLFLAAPPLWRLSAALIARLIARPPDAGGEEARAKKDEENPAPGSAALEPALNRPETAGPEPPPRPLITDRKKPEPAPMPEPARGDQPGAYKLPSLDLLDPQPSGGGHASGLTAEELEANARLLEEKLRDYGVEGRVTEVSGGPVITMYEYEPAPGIKISRVAGLAEDLAMAMKAKSIRVVGQVPGKGAIGIEIPNLLRVPVSFRQMAESRAFRNSGSSLTLILGVDILGSPVTADLAKMPHLLIAGATGTGKSVALASMILSLLYKATPEKTRLLMIDPKVVEFALYRDIPHLIYPVLTDPAEAASGLKWAVAEMETRYRLLAENGARHIDGYNEKIRLDIKKGLTAPDGRELRELPYLVIIIDELADLMMVAPKEVELHVTRLAQKARAAGIHLILATQRPTTDIITGLIKANLPTRLSLKVLSQIDSRTILDQKGAEKLLGAGDMLFLPPGQSELKRLHGPYVSDGEIKRVADFIRAWGPPDYLENLASPEAEGEAEEPGEDGELYAQAVALVRRTGRCSISFVQRHLRVGYNRAARLVERMESEGLIGPQNGAGPREIR